MKAWNNLPTEILQTIFLYTSSTKDRCNCTLVCKNWKQPTQQVLYKSIRVYASSSMKRFNNTVERDQRLGNLVKAIDLVIDKGNDFNQTIAITKLLSQLPCLERLHFTSACYYLSVLNALLDSKLPRLKWMNPPIDEEQLADYATCSLLMKDRLEHLRVSDVSEFNEEKNKLLFYRLYDRLDQFQHLTNIIVEKKTKDEISILDHVVEACPSLTAIDFYSNSDDTDEDELIGTNTDDIKTKYIPRTNIKTLKCNTSISSRSENFLLYITHKYPQLKSICVELNSDSMQLSYATLKQFLLHISKMEHYEVLDLVAEPENMAKAIGNFWKEGGDTPTNNVSFKYSQLSNDPPKLELIGGHENENDVIIEYPVPDFVLEHMNVIENYGTYMNGQLEITFSRRPPESQQVKDLIRGQFIPHLFKNCPNIIHLVIGYCTLQQINFDVDDTSRQIDIHTLDINNSEISYGIFKELSKVLPELNFLYLYQNKHRDSLGNLTSNITVDMINTKIGELNLMEHKNPHRGNRYIYLKVFSQIHGTHHYKYDLVSMDDNIFKAIGEQEYHDDAVNLNTHIYIRCRSIAALQVKYKGTIVSMPSLQ